MAFEPWEVDALSPRFEAIALDNLVAAGKISECDRRQVKFVMWVTAYPPERYAHVRPLLRQWEEREFLSKLAAGQGPRLKLKSPYRKAFSGLVAPFSA